MNPVIVIPTYVSARRRKEGGNVLTTYDHTTPITQLGELPRCLESLRQVIDVGPIIILVVSEPGIEVQAAEKIQKVALKYSDLDIVVVGAPEHALIQQRMEQLGLGKLQTEIALSSYGALRNLGLVVANTLGFDAVVFIDDDEVIEDPEFLHNAMYGMGKLTKKGIPILVKTGFFFNSYGSFLSASQDMWYNRFWQQGKAFNKWISHAMRGPRLSRSNYVCGGCLVLHKEAFKRLSFDPWITRGEDLDYMLNLRMYGSDVWFDNQWSLSHRPPATPSEGTRFRQDIYRWLYEFRKLEYSRTQIDLLQVKTSSLEPYPGPFLEPGILNRIRLTAFLRSLARPDKKAYRKAAKAATGEATLFAQRHCSKYFEFQFVWPEIMTRMENDTILTTALVRSITQRQAIIHSGSTGIDPGSTSEIRLNVAE
ncbi:MAG: glycosyltransferase family 2 protein [Eggerthellaceae bacterium]|jgi:hypothetical protein|nr:glycosyltransferase family 2 protein [Eggerthellaceae bacterium]MDR2721595.1 glycosyltransferase family 2 protein [Coriobacteriaceae bacterium]